MQATPQKLIESPGKFLRLALITPARNEADLIEETLKAVISQVVRPSKWIIVSDGSTDGTDAIVARYAASHPWIHLVRAPERAERHFAGKVRAFNVGLSTLREDEYDLLGNLDADITFDPDYLRFLVERFGENPRLGVAGTPFREDDQQHYDYRIVSTQHVSGACQIFRRQCFEQIGGFIPSKAGGVDLLAVISARMRGWETRSFLEKSCNHHRKMGSARHGALTGAFHGGFADYKLGCDPIWVVGRSLYRMPTLRPYVLNGLLCLAGYVWGFISRTEKVVPPELERFRRWEERRRLLEMVRRLVPR